MRLRSGCVGLTLLFFSTIIALGCGGQESPQVSVSHVSFVSPSTAGTAPVTRRMIQSRFSYFGSYTKIGKFRDASNLGCLHETSEDALTSTPPEALGAPPWMLHTNERTIYDFDPPIYRKGTARQRSRYSALLDPVVQSAYGAPEVLHVPRYVTLDGRGRLIVSDSSDSSIHVFGATDKDSFRILTGRQYRVKAPEGIATDKAGNIYIVDSEAGLVVVYDPSGNFRRRIGTVQNEPMFQRPTAIAIDPERGRVFVADTPRNVIVMLDLQGTYIKQIGKGRNGQGEPEFLRPTAIAVDSQGLAVLDSDGTRLWLLSPAGHSLGSFQVGQYLQGKDESDSLAFDREGHIFVSSANVGAIFEFTRGGESMVSFGQRGLRRGEFREPKGLWLDGSDRIYVADSQNSRVQVFQITEPEDNAPLPNGR